MFETLHFQPRFVQSSFFNIQSCTLLLLREIERFSHWTGNYSTSYQNLYWYLVYGYLVHGSWYMWGATILCYYHYQVREQYEQPIWSKQANSGIIVVLRMVLALHRNYQKLQLYNTKCRITKQKQKIHYLQIKIYEKRNVILFQI